MLYRPTTPGPSLPAPRRGVALLAVMVVVVLLSLAAYQYAELMMSEYKAADSAARAVQARAAAESGVWYAAALLADPNSVSGTLNGNPYDNPNAFQQVVAPNDVARRQARFSILAPPDPDTITNGGGSGGAFRYGVTDEAGKINLNGLMRLDPSGQVLHDVLMKLPNMTEEIADAIVDWIDADDTPRQNGAENEYYSALSPPYQCKNGPLDSLDELLLVRGVTPDLLYGADLNRNGLLDGGESDSSGTLGVGWAAYLTVYSREPNVDSTGQKRANVNDSNLSTLYDSLSQAVGADLAGYIIAYRTNGGESSTAPAPRGPNVTTGQASQLTKDKLNLTATNARAIPSLFALINTRVSITTTQGRTSQTTVYNCPLNDQSQLATLLPTMLDKLTTQSGSDLPGRVNVLTATRAVLAALPGLDDTTVQTILDNRPTFSASSGDPGTDYQTPAWLMLKANLTATQMQALERYVTSRTQVYRFQSLGTFDGGGPAVRVEAVIDTNAGSPRLLFFRDLTDLGRGYDLSNPNAGS